MRQSQPFGKYTTRKYADRREALLCTQHAHNSGVGEERFDARNGGTGPAENPVIFHPSGTGNMSEHKNESVAADQCWQEAGDKGWAEVDIPVPFMRRSSAVMKTRRCDSCGHRFPWDGAPYKTVCDSCYRTKTRSCVVCHVGTIRAGAPEFYKVCTSCWVDAKRSKCYSPCPTCPPERANHLRVPPGKQRCLECDAYFASAANN